MSTLDVPVATPLKGIPDVELVAIGSWNASTGKATITEQDLHQAIGALDCPGVHNPVLKLGHMEPDPDGQKIRWDGTPAVGWVSNMRLSGNGAKLLGDYTGVPGWLVDVMPTAYPQRSVEIQREFTCQIGHTHPFVITAVSLLGEYAPAVGVIKSLHDVAALFTGDGPDIALGRAKLAAVLPVDPVYRDPTDVEIRSTADFERDRNEWETAVAGLLAAWPAIGRAQRQQLATQIVDHIDAGRYDRLAGLDVDADAATDLIYAVMVESALQARDDQLAEARRQGLLLDVPDPDERWLHAAAAGIAATMASTLAATAGRNAAQLAAPGVSGDDVADGVGQHLDELSDRFLVDQFAGAVGAARMAGRYTVLNAAPTGEYYASELNDTRTCLHPDTVVTTKAGPVRISDVRPGDPVLGHSGRWLPVSATMRTDVDEELIRLRLADGRAIRLTYDHPVVVSTGGRLTWRYAGQLAVGDLVVDHTSLQGGRKVRVPDLNLGEPPHGVAARFKVRSLPTVDVGSQGVPVRPVGLDDETLSEHEVTRPRADAGLGVDRVPTAFQGLPDTTNVIVVEISAVGRERYTGPVYDLTVLGDETFFADGVLVHNCHNCRLIDSTRFGSLDEAMSAYGSGGYNACSGGGRCRGRLITVWEVDTTAAFTATVPTTVSLSTGGAPMPLPATIQARVSAEDISRSYYQSAGYSNWITAMHVDPLELVVCDDSTGDFFRVPVTLDGDDYEFGEPIQVKVEYVDVQTPAAKTKVKATAVYADDTGMVRLSAFAWHDRAEALDIVGGEPDITDRYARGGVIPASAVPAVAADVSPAGAAIRKMAAATQTPAADPAAGPTTPEKEASGMPFDADKLREALGLGADASANDALTAFAGALATLGGHASTPAPASHQNTDTSLSANSGTTGPDPVVVPQLADGNRPILLDPTQLAQLQESARKGETAWAQLRRNERDGVIDEAVRLGKFPAARREYWVQLWDRDPGGTRDAISALAANVIPVLSQGYLGDDAATRSAADQAFEGLYGKEA